jgi:hypothetical protein
MESFKIKDLQYTYNHDGIFTHIDSANKQDKYYLDIDKKIPLVFCKGSVVKPYFRTEANISADVLREYLGGSESLEHYNAKMEFWRTKKMLSNNNMIVAHTSKVEYRIKEINKVVDVAFFDKNGDLLIAIEVLHTNPKKFKDIQKFNQINTPVYEYNINTRTSELISYGYFNKHKREEQQRDSKRIVKGKEHIQRLKEDIRQLNKEVRKDDYDYEEEKREIEPIEREIELIEGGCGSNLYREYKAAEEYNSQLREQIERIEGKVRNYSQVILNLNF